MQIKQLASSLIYIIWLWTWVDYHLITKSCFLSFGFLFLKVISVQEKVLFRRNKKLSHDIWSIDYAPVLVGSYEILRYKLINIRVNM